MEYVIKNCQEKDLPNLIKLCQKHAYFEAQSYDPTNKSQLLKKALFTNPPKLFCCVIESQQQLAGYFTYTFDFSTWDAQTYLHLDCLYLEPEFRGQKIGQKIIHKLKEIAQQNQCINLQWQTPTFNKKAIQFYQKNGATSKEKTRFFLDPSST